MFSDINVLEQLVIDLPSDRQMIVTLTRWSDDKFTIIS